MEPIAMTEYLPGLLNWELFIQVLEVVLSICVVFLISSVFTCLGMLLRREGCERNPTAIVLR